MIMLSHGHKFTVTQVMEIGKEGASSQTETTAASQWEECLKRKNNEPIPEDVLVLKRLDYIKTIEEYFVKAIEENLVIVEWVRQVAGMAMKVEELEWSNKDNLPGEPAKPILIPTETLEEKHHYKSALIRFRTSWDNLKSPPSPRLISQYRIIDQGK